MRNDYHRESGLAGPYLVDQCAYPSVPSNEHIRYKRCSSGQGGAWYAYTPAESDGMPEPDMHYQIAAKRWRAAAYVGQSYHLQYIEQPVKIASPPPQSNPVPARLSAGVPVGYRP